MTLISRGYISPCNSTTTPLAGGATFTGKWEQVYEFASISIIGVADVAGTLYADFSIDGTTLSRQIQLSSGDTVDFGIHSLISIAKFFRLRVVNGATPQTAMGVQVILNQNSRIALPTSRLAQTITDYSDVLNTRAVLVGETKGGDYLNVPVSSEGKLQIDVPKTAFGELSVAENTPQVQAKFPAGIDEHSVQILTNKTGSTVTAVDGLCTITAAGVAESFSQIRTLDVVRYGPGQGMNVRFTASFTTGVANSTQWAGPGDDDEMLGVGYNGTAFGILHRKLGELEVRDITITAGGDAGGGTFTLTLDGTAVTITVPAGSATIADICALIVAASADIFNAGRGWEVHTDDSKTVTFISLVAENATGTFSFADVDSGVTAGTFEQATTTLEGVAPTETIIPQTSWNVDVMDGTGPTGMTLDPTKLNVFDISFQYLGAGNLFFCIEAPETGRFEPIHMIKVAGQLTAPTFRNPTFHLNMIAKTELGYTGGALTINTSSLAGFIEGKEGHIGARHNAITTVSTNGTTEVVNMVLHNEEQFNGTRNKVESYIDHITVINASTRSVLIDLYRSPTHINSGVTLASVDAHSPMEFGAGTGTRTGGELLLPIAVSASDSKDLDIEHLGLKVRPSETMVFTATKGSGGNDGTVTIGASWLERH